MLKTLGLVISIILNIPCQATKFTVPSIILLQIGENIKITSPTFEKTWLNRGNIVSVKDTASHLQLRGKNFGQVRLNIGNRLFTIYVVPTKTKKDFILIKNFLAQRKGLSLELKENIKKQALSKLNIHITGELLRLKDFKDLIYLTQSQQIPFWFSAKVPVAIQASFIKYLQTELKAKAFNFKNTNLSFLERTNMLWHTSPVSIEIPSNHLSISLYQKLLSTYGLLLKIDSTLLAQLPIVELKILLAETNLHQSQQNNFSWNTYSNPEAANLDPLNSNNFIPDLLTQSYQKWLSIFKTMESKGKAHILAEAVLLNEHGKTAHFHSGGKVAVLHYHKTTGAESIQWKPYGVQLRFKTQIGRKKNIQIHSQISISDVDHTYSSRQAASLKSNSLTNTFSLQDGQSLALATLIRRQKGENYLSPWLISRIPIIKMLSQTGNIQAHTRLNIILRARRVQLP